MAEYFPPLAGRTGAQHDEWERMQKATRRAEGLQDVMNVALPALIEKGLDAKAATHCAAAFTDELMRVEG